MQSRPTTSKTTLHTQLQTEFDLVCFVDLADVAHDHGMIWRLFKKLHRDPYLPHQRLVFYAGETPPQLVIDHMQRAAKRVDISNFFILVCGPETLYNHLKLSQSRFDMDIAMQYREVNVIDAEPLEPIMIYPHDTLCMAPFVNLSINQYHRAAPCCKLDRHDHSVATLEQGIMGAMNHEAVKELREYMLKGQKHPKCHVCWHAEKSGGTSLRRDFLIKFQDYEDRVGNDIMSPVSIEMSPSNLCNFKCRICNEDRSSTIAMEKLRNQQDSSQRARLITLTKDYTQDSIHLMDQLDSSILADIRFLHIMGGEPMLLKGLKSLLQKMIDQGAHKKINLEFNTNASVYDSELIEMICQFSGIEISLSIDDMGTRFEIQRGGRWSDIDQNIRTWARLNSSNRVIKLSPTINIQNVLYLDQLVAYAHDIGIRISWHYVHQPDFLSIDCMTSQAQELVYRRYCDHEISEFRAIAQRVKQSPPITDRRFIDYIHTLDRIRNQDFGKYHSEIYLAMHA